MGGLSNFGSTLLDVQQGMEYAKTNDRRDAAFALEQQRADTENKKASLGLEEYQRTIDDTQRTRGDVARNRSAAAGSSSIAEATAAQEKAALAGGDVASAAGARTANLQGQRDSLSLLENEHKALMAKVQNPTELANAQGAAGRAPGLQTVADQQLKDQIQENQTKQVATIWRMTKNSPRDGEKAVSESDSLYPGKSVEFRFSPDGQKMVIMDKSNQQPLQEIPIAQLNQIEDQVFSKTTVVPAGASVTKTSPGGQTTSTFTAPDHTNSRPMAVPDGAKVIYDPRRGFIPVPNTGPRALTPKELIARQKTVSDQIDHALGKNPSSTLQDKAIRTRAYAIAAVLARDPSVSEGEVAAKAIEQATRDIKGAPKGTTNPGLAGSGLDKAKILDMLEAQAVPMTQQIP